MNNVKSETPKGTAYKSAKLSNFDKMTSVIKKATDKNLQSVIIPLELFEYAGDVQKAVFLARLIYLSDKGSKSGGWIWKTYSDWKAETGLSQSQVERIILDFHDKRKIIEVKKMMAASKNGNASHTWHYRLLMDKFLVEFKKFLVVRSRKNSGLEPEESAGSITESTYRHTTDNTLYEVNNFGQEIKKEEEEIVKEENWDDIITTDFDEDYYSEEDCSEAATQIIGVSLPSTFVPSLESQIWAVNSFVFNSPKLITGKFVDYYTTGKGKAVKKTLDQWERDWRNWVSIEKTIGATRESFENEHNEIRNELFNLIYRYIADYENYLVPHNEILTEFCEKRNFDQWIIEEYVEDHLRLRNTSKFFDCHYVLSETDPAWNEAVDKAMLAYLNSSVSSIPKEIAKFVRTNLVVTEEDIQRAFTDVSQDSINHLLRIGVAINGLTEDSGFYHRSFSSISESSRLEPEQKQRHIDAITSKLAELKNNY